ncbi:MAG: hypothetical protein KDD58_12870 [Bdellovibrionales bacterium]|nr:hypothetical protein [Bdellovibrionales bacterium]
MQNNLSFFIFVNILVSCFSFISCSHFSKKPEPAVVVKEPGKIELKLKSIEGRIDLTDYYSHSKIKTFEQNQLVREKDEIVEFKVKSESVKPDNNNNFIRTIVTTLEKDGLVDLHDLAFPEVKERIEFVFRQNADVLYAGSYPQSSVFYVPPLSLPDEKVEIGDTWEMQKSWVSMKNNIPLKLNLVTILKNIYECGKNEKCADLEVSGDIGIITTMNESTKFNSQISGRIIFLIDKGTILWSVVNSDESFTIGPTRLEVKSCLNSILREPIEDVWAKSIEAECDPMSDNEFKIPRL